MKELPAIEAVYLGIAAAIESERERAGAAGDIAASERAEQKRRINNSAYLILAWGQLEAEINSSSESAVRSRRSSIKWEDRRAWDLHDPDNMRTKFEDRAALVLDRFNVASDAYKRTVRYYGWRNNIAHGTSLANGLDVASIIQDFYAIAGEISR